MRFRLCTFLLIATFVLFLTSCGKEQKGKTKKEATSISLKYAERFSLIRTKTYVKVVISQAAKSSQPDQTYIIYPRSATPPVGFANEQIIATPIKSVITMSTTFLPHLAILGVLESLIAVADIKHINSEAVVARIKKNLIREVGGGTSLNIEKVMALNPELVLSYEVGMSKYNTHSLLKKNKIKVFLANAYLENHILGRLEWIKVIGLFYGQLEEATKYFDSIEKQYINYKDMASKVKIRPTVFCNATFSGVWYMPGGNSWFANLIADAGGKYLWDETVQYESLPLDFERVYLKAHKANIWLNPGYQTKSKAELKNMDARYSHFNAFKASRIYNNNKIMNKWGGNDIFETGAANPHAFLADLISIFHPELLPDHELNWFRKLE